MIKLFNKMGERVLMAFFGLYFYRFSFGVQKKKGIVVAGENIEGCRLHHVVPNIVFGTDKHYYDFMMQDVYFRKYLKYDCKLIYHDYDDSYEYVLYFRKKEDLESFTMYDKEDIICL